MRIVDIGKMLNYYVKFTGMTASVDFFMKRLEELPVLDVEPVVRCKDCKYATMTVNGECKYCDIWFPDEKTYIDGDYFCASGERKEGKANEAE